MANQDKILVMDDDSTTVRSRAGAAQAERRTMTTRHILIVDDEPKVAFFLGRAMERSDENYRVSVAHSGEEALEVLNRSHVDLLITDLRMPGISGLELIRWVQASSPQTRTILITAYGSDQVEAEARRLEAYHYITKPFDIGDFTQAAQEALRDVAISQPGFTILSDKSFEAITRQLEDLRHDVGAQCIFLADMLGQRLAEVGVTTRLDVAALLSLLAGGFATTNTLARHFGSGQSVNLNFHEGTRYEIYSANIGDNLFLTMVYDRRVQASRIGLVWLYTRRTIEGLLSILSTAEAPAPAQSLDTDFGSSLMTEQDTLLTDSPHPSPPPPEEGALQPSHLPPEEETLEPNLSHLPPMGGTEGGKQELFDIETAIAQGLIPANLDMQFIEQSEREP